MSSPFPGMDPYLEGELWQEFHETLASALRAQLMPRLAPKYVALLAKRYVLDRPALGVFVPPRVIYPDVHVVGPVLRGPAAGTSDARTGETMTIDAPAVELSSFTEAPQLAIEIRDVAERRLVTVIEILSPANKWGEGAREYWERRIDLLRTETHLLELDLLRGGTRIPLEGQPPPASYYIYLSRAERRPLTAVWPVGLRDRLPVVPVPLLSPDLDVPLDLGAAVRACFDLVGYERLITYTAPPPPPALGAEEMAWIDATLRDAGLRAG
jgi:hypothetical protein